MNFKPVAEVLEQQLDLAQAPVAVAFTDAPPANVERFTGTVPAGCAFWRLAAAGDVFWTAPTDHYNCPIGCHTHNIPLPAERAGELDDTLGLMIGNGYLGSEEIPHISRLQETPNAIVYAPLAHTPVHPDVVLVIAAAARIMLLQEAARSAGVTCNATLFGRPTCMALPAALSHGATPSLGCIGNRVYTEAGEGDMYLAIPASDLAAVVAQLPTITAANGQLRDYHQQRKQALTQP